MILVEDFSSKGQTVDNFYREQPEKSKLKLKIIFNIQLAINKVEQLKTNSAH